MGDLEMTRLCADAMGYHEYVNPDRRAPLPVSPCILVLKMDENATRELYEPLTNDAQTFALIKRFSLQIHHHGCANAKASLVTVTGKWLPYTHEFKVCANDLNHAIVEAVAKMQFAKVTKP